MRGWAARCICSAMAALLIATTAFVDPASAEAVSGRSTDGAAVDELASRETTGSPPGSSGDADTASAASHDRVLRVAFSEVEGISETDGSGVRSGIFYDWLTEISKYTGWRYEFVDGDIDDLVGKMDEGSIDLVGGMYYREQMADKYDYSRYAIGSNHVLLISRKDNDGIVGFDPQTLDGKTIGVFENAVEKIRRLELYLETNGLNCNVLPLDYASYSRCLENGTADVLLGSDSEMSEGRKVVANFEGEPYYIAMPKGSDLARDLDEAMTSIYLADSSFAEELDAKHLPTHYQSSIKFSDADLAYVERTREVKVAVVGERYPLYYESDGSNRGIVKDVLDRVTERSGLEFRIVHADTYKGAIDLVKRGEADMVGCFLDDEYVADGEGLAITHCFASLNEVVFRNKLASSQGSVFAQIEGRIGSNGVEASEVVYYRTYEDCLEAVNSGRADLTSMPVAFAESFFTDQAFNNITPATSEHHEATLSFAFPKPVDTPLYSVMSKAVNSFSEDELDTIFSRNTMPAFGQQRTIQAVVSENPLLVVALGLVLCLFVGAIVVTASVAKVRNRMMEMKLEKVEEMGRAKTDFLSRMSHEIRTPMNAIIGLSSVASLSGEATPSIRSSLEKINTSAQFLLSLVNDILDMSKIENDKMKIVTAPLSLRSLAERLESMFCIQAEEKGIVLEARCDADDVVLGDDVRLQQVLANLLSNALKFTDPGDGIRLGIGVLVREQDSVRVRFSVKDTGAGIREEDLERIFVSFEQASENRRNAQGTGLGLAISSNLVRLMGGKLDVQSVLGKGSEFFFILDLPTVDRAVLSDAAASCAADEASARSLEGTSALLAEDNDLNAEIAVALLEMEGVRVQRAANGREAVDMFAASEPGSFDFVLMDVKMPVLDGLEAAAEIRRLDRPDAKTTHIIALTANTFQEDREDAAAAGMDGFVPKPFDARQLYDALRSFLPPEK